MSILIVAIASALFGAYPSIQNIVLEAGVTPIALVTVCNGLAAVISLIMCKAAHIPVKVNKKELISLMLIGLIGQFVTDYFLDISYTLIPVGYVTMIHFMFPTLVCIVTVVFFKEKFTKGKALVIALSVAGLLLLAGSSFSGSAMGIVTALISAGAYTYYMIATDKTASGVDPLARTFYTNAVAAVISLFFWIPEKPVLPSSAPQWGLCVVIGAMLCAATFLLNLGVKKVGAGTASFFNMLEPVISMAVSMIVFHYSITAAAVIGCVLILGSVLFAAKSQK